jgi:PLP dependent protein
MQTISSLKDRCAEVTERIARAAERVDRSERDIMLVIVTKYAEPEQILDLIQLGYVDFGESRVQQLAQRASMVEEWLDRRRTLPAVTAAHHISHGLRDPDGGPLRLPDEVRWHMIGHLQRNKVKKAIEHARLVHSVDSLRLGEEIHTAAMRHDKIIDVLLEVNSSGETSKGGVALPAAVHVAEQLDTMVNLRLRGLMTMAPKCENPENARLSFQRCKEIFDDIRKTRIAAGHFNILSMGMSNDFEVAIECGANVVRVGSAIFGQGEPASHVSEEQRSPHADADSG